MRTFVVPAWRLAHPLSIGSLVDHFHAYDEDDRRLCKPMLHLLVSIAEPTEGSKFCPDCMGIVRGQ